LIEKLKPEDVKPSSRQYPWIRFEFDEKEKLHRQAVEIENLGFAYPGSSRKIFRQVHPEHSMVATAWRSSAKTVSARRPC
jgi:hypothetical protein